MSHLGSVIKTNNLLHQLVRRCVFPECSAERDVHESNSLQRGHRHCSPVPGQHPSEWDGQGCGAHPHPRGGASLPHMQAARRESDCFLLYMNMPVYFFMQYLPIRSSPKKLRSTSGRESMRRAERRSWRWGMRFHCLSGALHNIDILQ